MFKWIWALFFFYSFHLFLPDMDKVYLLLIIYLQIVKSFHVLQLTTNNLIKRLSFVYT